MKQRLISAGIGLCLFFVILFMFDTIFFNLIVAAVATFSIFEFLHAYKMEKYMSILVTSCVFSSAVPFVVNRADTPVALLVVFAYVAFLIAYSLKNHSKITVSQIAIAFFISLVFTFSLMPLLFIRDQFGLVNGLYYTLLIFACSWGSDSGAYFVGRFFGKKKLAPNLSPNKTVEGVFGGVLSCFIFATIITICFYYFQLSNGETFNINIFALIGITAIGSIIGVLGDLFASMIKRQQGIKDFGKIMPGHGGLVDRLDSTFFVTPFFFVALQVVKIVV